MGTASSTVTSSYFSIPSDVLVGSQGIDSFQITAKIVNGTIYYRDVFNIRKGVATSSVATGVFNVNIGDTANGFPDTLDYNFQDNKDVYLQVEVSSDNSTFQTLSPRQKISSVPFAQLSTAVSGSVNPSSFGTTTPFGTSVVSVQATSTASTALSLRSVLGQIADIFNIKDR